MSDIATHNYVNLIIGSSLSGGNEGCTVGLFKTLNNIIIPEGYLSDAELLRRKDVKKKDIDPDPEKAYVTLTLVNPSKVFYYLHDPTLEVNPGDRIPVSTDSNSRVDIIISQAGNASNIQVLELGFDEAFTYFDVVYTSTSSISFLQNVNYIQITGIDSTTPTGLIGTLKVSFAINFVQYDLNINFYLR